MGTGIHIEWLWGGQGFFFSGRGFVFQIGVCKRIGETVDGRQLSAGGDGGESCGDVCFGGRHSCLSAEAECVEWMCSDEGR